MRNRLKFSAISSLGTRDVAVDLTDALEVGELVSTADVVSSSVALLLVSNVQVNTDVLTETGAEAIEPGKGVQFSMAGQAVGSVSVVTLALDFVGDNGTADGYDVLQPIQERLSDGT